MEEDPKEITAEELLRQLESDPEWVARRDETEALRADEERRLEADEQPIVADLQRVGYEVTSVWDLHSTPRLYPKAVPVLLHHLKNVKFLPKTREGVARALSYKGAPEILPAMIESFQRDPDSSLNGPKWAKANAIEILFRGDYIEEVVELVLDPVHGDARRPLIYPVVRSSSPVAIRAVKQLQDDPLLSSETMQAIRNNGQIKIG